MKKNICLTLGAALLIACGGGGGGHNADDGGFQQPIAPELNVSFTPNKILPNPGGQRRVTALPRTAVADVTVYARQGNTPVENGDEELLISINDTIGNVPGIIYCYDFGNEACFEKVKDENGKDVEVPRPLGQVPLNLSAGRSYFSVTAANGQLGEIGVNITVVGPNNATVSKDIKIPVGYPSSGAPYQVNILSSDTLRPNSSADIYVIVSDEAGNPVDNPNGNNLLVTANNLANTVLGFAGETGTTVNGKTTDGVATISVLPREEGYLTLIAQADGADNSIDNGFQTLVTASKTIQVTNAYIPPAQNIVITTSKLPNGVVGEKYNDFTIATTGSAPINFVLDSGSLPPGITFNQGVLSGTPTLVGDYTFTVSVTAANGSTASQVLTLKVSQVGFKFDRTKFDKITAVLDLDPKKPNICSLQGQILKLKPLDGYTLASPFTWRMDATIDEDPVSIALGADHNAVRVVTANGIELPELDFTVTGDTTQVVLNGKVCPDAPREVFNGHAIILSATDANGVKFESVLPLVIELDVKPAPENNAGGGTTTNPICDGFSPIPPGCSDATALTVKVNTFFSTTIAGATATSTVVAGSLPPGINLIGGTKIEGTPSATGTYDFVLSDNTTSQAVRIIVEN
ncbi:MAG: hypothetical protein CSA45_05990 [Gammaproteobacteria bacterium]|nr:MAG: hypothetical protein CSA45_05990 [Gammaproteobacteria bacterium]